MQLIRHTVHHAPEQMQRREILRAYAGDAAAQLRRLPRSLKQRKHAQRLRRLRRAFQKPLHIVVAAFPFSAQHPRRLPEKAFQKGVGPSAAKRCAHEQISAARKRSCFQPGALHILRHIDGKLASGADVHQHGVRVAAGRAEEARLIVADGREHVRPALIASEIRLRRNARQQSCVDPGQLQRLAVEGSGAEIKHAKAGRVARVRTRRAKPAEAHCRVVMDGAEHRRIFRHKTVLLIIEMRDKAVPGRKRVSGQAAQVSGVGLPAARLLAASVLPCVKGTDRRAGGVEIDDAVHLPGHADGADIRPARKKRLDRLHDRRADGQRVLYSLPWCAAGQKAAVRQRQRIQLRTVFQHDRADRGRADIESQCFHFDPSDAGRAGVQTLNDVNGRFLHDPFQRTGHAKLRSRLAHFRVGPRERNPPFRVLRSFRSS